MATHGFGPGKNRVLVISEEAFEDEVDAVVDPKLNTKQDQHLTRGVTLAAGSAWGVYTTGGQSYYMQTVDVTGVTTTNTIIVSANPADPSNQVLYSTCGVFAAAQQAGKIVFLALLKPSSALSVNVVILGV